MDCTNDTVSTGHLSAVAGDHIHTEVADAFTLTPVVCTAETGLAAFPVPDARKWRQT